MTAIAPPRISRGQTIGVCAPAGPVKPGSQPQLQRGLDRLSEFRIQLAPTLTSPRPPGVPSYLSASDDQRASELMAMIRDPDVRAIVLARAGYGLTRILGRLDPGDLRRDPKPIVGFSDATALLAWAHAAGVRGIHGPMVVQLGDLPVGDAERLIAMLTSPAPLGRLPWGLDGYLGAGERTVRGPLVAANLTMASMLVGTRWSLPLADAIVLFEEVGEKPYELDRYLTQLIATGALRDVAGVVLGDLTRCADPAPPTGEPDPPEAAMLTVRERLESIGKPFATGAPVGHGERNEPVPFGAMCELDVQHQTLTISEGAVA